MTERPASGSRRRFLRGAGLGGAAFVGGALTSREVLARAPAGDPPAHGAADHAGADPYGGHAAPPPHLAVDALDDLTIPPPPQPGPVAHDFVVTERPLEVADGAVYDAWTYNGTAPGPILRGTAGQRLRVTVTNRTGHDHNLHLHGRHSPQMDGWEPIPPGQSFTYDVELAPAGVHPYHCHTDPLADHVGKGLYGALIVDPPEGRPAAHEFVLVLSGWDLDGDGMNELYTWNGVAGFFHRHPLTVPVGDLVRVYVVNMTEHDPVGSFHLHAQTFDVFRSGTSLTPDEHTDTVTLGQGERAVVEFRLPEQGRYMFHPHQHRMASRGAMGWFAAV